MNTHNICFHGEIKKKYQYNILAEKSTLSGANRHILTQLCIRKKNKAPIKQGYPHNISLYFSWKAYCGYSLEALGKALLVSTIWFL